VNCAESDYKTPFWNGTVCDACPTDKPKWDPGRGCSKKCPENRPIWKPQENACREEAKIDLEKYTTENYRKYEKTYIHSDGGSWGPQPIDKAIATCNTWNGAGVKGCSAVICRHGDDSTLAVPSYLPDGKCMAIGRNGTKTSTPNDNFTSFIKGSLKLEDWVVDPDPPHQLEDSAVDLDGYDKVADYTINGGTTITSGTLAKAIKGCNDPKNSTCKSVICHAPENKVCWAIDKSTDLMKDKKWNTFIKTN